MRKPRLASSESAIWSRILDPTHRILSPAAARSILLIEFSSEDKKRMQILAEKAREGTLSLQEQEEIRNYERVGNLLALMQSKARLRLKKTSHTNGSAH
jgi:hypothetical protein